MAEKLVIYDSYFGNTCTIAEAIGEELGDADVKKAADVNPADLKDCQILFVGSPTRAFRPSPAVTKFLKGLERNTLNGVQAAAFDTRFPLEGTDSGFLRFMIKLFGYAAEKIEKSLSRAGASIQIKVAGFAVLDSEGPLAEGERERAKIWAKGIL